MKKRQDIAKNIDKIHNLPSQSLEKDLDFQNLKRLFLSLKQKYGKSKILQELDSDHFIPTSIFIKELSALETVSKFLVENKNLKINQIAKLLKRSTANIHGAYKRSNTKYSKKLEEKDSILIPISKINSKFTLLENIVSYLKETSELTFHQIAEALHRDDRTIWTVYSNYKKKNGQ